MPTRDEKSRQEHIEHKDRTAKFHRDMRKKLMGPGYMPENIYNVQDIED